MEPVEVSSDQCLLLFSRPAFELALAANRGGFGFVILNVCDFDGAALCGEV